MRSGAFFLFTFFFLISSPLSSLAQSAIRSYTFNWADPDELFEAAKRIVPGSRKVLIQREHKKLMVIGTKGQQEAVKALIARMEKPVRGVRIDVRLTKKIPGRESTESLRSLEAVDGRASHLTIGHNVRHLDWFQDNAYLWSGSRERADWTVVGTRLSIVPTIVGEGKQALLSLDVVPELFGTVNGKPHHVAFGRAATRLFARNGTAVKMKNMTSAKDFFSRFLDQGAWTYTELAFMPRLADPEKAKPAGIEQPFRKPPSRLPDFE